jgi:hypothetical protein
LFAAAARGIFGELVPCRQGCTSELLYSADGLTRAVERQGEEAAAATL